MINRLFSILTVLLISLPFMNCGLPPGSMEDPLDDPQQQPQQARLHDEVKGNTKKDDINDIAYSPDGTKLAVAAGNGIWLYDAQTGQELVQCAGHIDKVFNLAFRPDGKTMASVGIGHDRTIRIWDVHTGKNLRTFEYQAWDVAFSPDGKTIVCGSEVSDDYNLNLFDADTGKLIRTLSGHTNYSGHTDYVMSLAFSPDGKTIAGAGNSANVSLWDADTGKLLRTLTVETYPTLGSNNSVTFSPDGRMIVSQIGPGTIGLWDVHTGKRLQAITNVPSIQKASSVFSPDGKMIAWRKSLDIVLWDVNTGKEVRTLTGYRENNPLRRDRFGRYIWSEDAPFVFLAFNPDGKTIATAGFYSVHLWDVNTGYLRKIIQF